VPIPSGEIASPRICTRFQEFTGVASSEPLHSRIATNRKVAKRTPTSAPTRRHSHPEPQSDERKKRWAALDANLLPAANFARHSAMLQACLDELGDSPDAA